MTRQQQRPQKSPPRTCCYVVCIRTLYGDAGSWSGETQKHIRPHKTARQRTLKGLFPFFSLLLLVCRVLPPPIKLRKEKKKGTRLRKLSFSLSRILFSFRPLSLFLSFFFSSVNNLAGAAAAAEVFRGRRIMGHIFVNPPRAHLWRKIKIATSRMESGGKGRGC